MFETIYSQIGTAITILVVGFAFLKGDEPERIGGAAFVMVGMASMLLPDNLPRASMQLGVMALDLVLIAVFLGLAWHTRRNWPIWAGAFQALILTGHILVMADLRPAGNALAAVNNMSNYGLLAALAVGTFWAWQERRAAGLER